MERTGSSQHLRQAPTTLLVISLLRVLFIMSKVRKLRDTDFDFTDLGEDEEAFGDAVDDPFAFTISHHHVV